MNSWRAVDTIKSQLVGSSSQWPSHVVLLSLLWATKVATGVYAILDLATKVATGVQRVNVEQKFKGFRSRLHLDHRPCIVHTTRCSTDPRWSCKIRETLQILLVSSRLWFSADEKIRPENRQTLLVHSQLSDKAEKLLYFAHTIRVVIVCLLIILPTVVAGRPYWFLGRPPRIGWRRGPTRRSSPSTWNWRSDKQETNNASLQSYETDLFMRASCMTMIWPRPECQSAFSFYLCSGRPARTKLVT